MQKLVNYPRLVFSHRPDDGLSLLFFKRSAILPGSLSAVSPRLFRSPCCQLETLDPGLLGPYSRIWYISNCRSLMVGRKLAACTGSRGVGSTKHVPRKLPGNYRQELGKSEPLMVSRIIIDWMNCQPWGIRSILSSVLMLESVRQTASRFP